jgi:hypothetical protein
MDFKPIFKTPDNSVLASLATVAIVAGIYQLDAGPVSQVHASDAFHPANSTGIKKAGWTSLVAVAGLFLLTKDANQVIIGGAAVIALHAHYRHANMVNPGTGQVELKGADVYQNAQNTSALQAVA